MELAVRRLPFHVDGVVFRRPLLDLGEPMQGRNNPYFPVIIAILDRPPDQIDLDQDARMREIRQIIQRDRRDLVAPLFLGDDQAFGGQQRQGFAQGREAGAKRQPQRVELQRFVRLELAGDDLVAQPVRNVGGERLSEFLARLEGRRRH